MAEFAKLLARSAGQTMDLLFDSLMNNSFSTCCEHSQPWSTCRACKLDRRRGRMLRRQARRAKRRTNG